MKYKDLPKIIDSPITGNQLFLLTDDDTNGEPLSVAQELSGSIEFYDPYIAQFRSADKVERLYVTYDVPCKEEE